MRPKPLALLGTLLALTAPGAASAFDHAAWDEIVQRYVDADGRVAYRALAENDRPALTAYLERIAAADPSTLTRPEALAFYINAYNATVFDAVLEGATAESFFSRVRFFGLSKHDIGGRSISLKSLEDDVIRAEFKDPRIHFALVCASTSCPKLARRAYTAENLDALLDEKGREFLADRSRNPLGAGPKVEVSQIFKWFDSDFEEAAGSVQAFVARWAGDRAPACLATNSCRLSYVGYDWSLNAQPGQRPE